MAALVEFARRPGLGSFGRATRVRTNFFEVTSLPDGNIMHYDATITPDVPPALNRRIFQELERIYGATALAGARPVYDGRKNIFSSKNFAFGDAYTFDVTLAEDDGAPSGKRPPRAFKIRIKKVGEINMEELHRFLNNGGSETSNCLTAITALDVLIRYRPSLRYETVGRSFYTSSGAMQISGGAEIWQGYYQSARPTMRKMMINIDLSATAFYKSGNLVDTVVSLVGCRSPDDLRRGLQERERMMVEKAIKNLKIRVIHRGDTPASRRKHKIMKLTQTSANNTRFDIGGTTQDVASYFQSQYHRRLQYPFLPCVVVRKDVFFPMEVCDVVEGQRHIRKLNEKQVADMIRFTCQPPNTRANKIMQGVEILDYRRNEYLQQFGMQISREMAVIPARILPTPKIEYHQSSREPIFQPKDGVWNLRDKKVATGATLGSWSVVVFGHESQYPPQAVQAFIRELVVTCQDTGMNIPNRTPPIRHHNPQGNIEETLKQLWLLAGNTAKAHPQLILCVLPNTGVDLYAEIKRVCDTIIGVASQCIQAKHMLAAKKQYCANVCLKMNVKIGGMNSFLSTNQLPFVTDRPTILMGADVTHPSASDPSRPSIAGLCSSVDAKASQYAAAVRIQEGKSEIIADLSGMIKQLLRTFYQSCGRKPDRIVFYRDGVSDGQFAQVLKSEIEAIKGACQGLESEYKPTITFIVVQKRHHTRFFPIDKRDADRTGNCLPGTVIESDITHPYQFDFYLQSHAGLQGTSRPTHYRVLYDENNFNADTLQTMSYNLCYLYARCTRAVSLVPPVYYAHLVCNRARFHARGGNWSDSESSGGGAGVVGTFGTVRPELERVMYYM
ncbi:Piwi-domain-containing protein [Gigaspora margarita]|uniref:Piwi-domain-containing protein n=1 Tax=Gigaspora margarita TaxID=4874 RepID=A0A8H4EP67_GIGMA|nr:Piwi-domain-containing protein [Gigaspora margarita]